MPKLRNFIKIFIIFFPNPDYSQKRLNGRSSIMIMQSLPFHLQTVIRYCPTELPQRLLFIGSKKHGGNKLFFPSVARPKAESGSNVRSKSGVVTWALSARLLGRQSEENILKTMTDTKMCFFKKFQCFIGGKNFSMLLH
jgi:hypothetical protein